MVELLNEQWLFPKTASEAIAAQKEMAERVLLQDQENSISHLAAMDNSNMPFDPKKMIFGAVVVLSYPSLDLLQTAGWGEKHSFPYIPGLLGFREAPPLIHAYEQLTIKPDVIMVDGHGVSHPRGLGVASHLGVLLDIPTIGVAKSILVGTPADVLSQEPGSMTPLLYKNKEIGMLLRTKKGSHPLIISAGHKMTLQSAVKLVLSTLRGRRLPEPIRQAHLAANHCRTTFQHS